MMYKDEIKEEVKPSSVDHIITILKEFDGNIITYLMISDWEQSFITEYPNLKTSLDKFKNQYIGRQ